MKPVRSGLALLGVAVLVGCDIPTDVPMVEQRWIIPVENTSISAEEFLPTGVSIAGDLFSVAVDPFTAVGTLGSLCATCVNGATGPLPSFAGTFSASQSFPADVTGAVLESGAVSVAVQNGFSFDPIAGGGSVVITITDGPGGKVLGQSTISTALAPGATVARGITLAGGPVSPFIMATAEVTCPGGQTTTVDAAQTLVLSVEVAALQASFATVNVANQDVSIADIDLDVSDIDSTVTDHIRSGAITFDITNPFGVAVKADLVITFPGGTLVRTLDISAAAVSTTSLSYSGDDLRSFLGKDGVILRGAGTVSAASGAITVRPDERLILDATMDLTLILG